ncbi:MAG: uroporphyrinogen decarboxylase [Alphaproteobacteria bacterium]|nr:uroporphyrinogen decarboxylase [Alphaproteobacteria bacterium]
MTRIEKPFLQALKGEKQSRTPFWFMRQAGRYLPEYRELRARKKGFLDMAFDPKSACEITMQPIRRFGMDAAIIFSDILVVPYALGQHLEFVEGEGPKLDALKSSSEFSRLGFKNFDSLLSPVYEAITRVKTELHAKGFNATALIGFAGAPWTLAAYMVEGGGSKDFIAVKSMAYRDPHGFSQLIEILVEAVSQCLVKQIRAGAEAVQIFDSWAGVLDSHEFEKWVTEPTKKIAGRIAKEHPEIPVIGFPRNAGQNYVPYVQKTGISAVGLDSHVPASWAAKNLQSLVPVQGNLDPVCLLAGGDALLLATEHILNSFSGGPFVFNLGHGVHKDTPVEHVEALVKILKEHRLQEGKAAPSQNVSRKSGVSI